MLERIGPQPKSALLRGSLLLSLAFLIATSCQYQQEHNPPPMLRVVNAGNEDLKALAVLFPGKTADAQATQIEFGDVPAGQTTAYQEVPSGVYRYAAYQYQSEGREVIQPVVDWVGECPKAGAKFTYRVVLDTKKVQGNQVQLLEVVVDKP